MKSVFISFVVLSVMMVVCLGMIVPKEGLTRVRRETNRKYYTKIMTCVRNKLGSAENKEARCVIREMLRVFQVKDSVKCKNCDQFFFCTSNLNARRECGDHSHVIATSEAVSQCQDSQEDSESLTVAAAFGRNNGNCGQEYLCSSGCRFASSNETCTLNCR